MRVVVMFAAMAAATAVSGSAVAGVTIFEGIFDPGSPATISIISPSYIARGGSIHFDGGDLVSVDYSGSTDLIVNRDEYSLHVEAHCSASFGEQCIALDNTNSPKELVGVSLSTHDFGFSTPSTYAMAAFAPPLPSGSYFRFFQPSPQFSVFTFNFAPGTGPIHYRAWTSDAPEPATWSLMLGGFGIAGAALRRRRRAGA